MDRGNVKDMKLLIITQKVDKDDPVLGFFHRWLEEFSKYFDFVTVICLQKGESELPENIKVLSLGKERGANRLKYIYNFYKYIWTERKKYDTVFVHMNPEYVVLGGCFWKILRKKIYLWYVHRHNDVKLKLAILLANKIFSVSKDTFPVVCVKNENFGHGIDVKMFSQNKQVTRGRNTILYLGRLSPIKNIEKIIDSLEICCKKFLDIRAVFVGNFSDEGYKGKILLKSKSMIESGRLIFKPAVPNYQTPNFYNKYEILVNLTEKGSYDKVILEAMACGMMALSANNSFKDVLGDLFINDLSPDSISKKILRVLNMSVSEKEKYAIKFREYVVQNHNLEKLIKNISNVINK